MKKTTDTQTKALVSLEAVKFRIQTVEDVGEALTFSRKLKDFADEVEKKVKERSTEILDDNNKKQIETDEYLITRIDASETQVFKVLSVVEGIGVDRALPFLKVNGGKLKWYLSKAVKEGAVTWDEVRTCQEKMTTKNRKGFLTIRKR